MMNVYETARALESRCDGAVSYDGMGYNKYDARKVPQLLNMPKTEENERYLFNIIKKYKNQLMDMGIIEENIDELDFEFNHNINNNNEKESEEMEEEKMYDVELDKNNENIIIKFDYNPKLISLVKSMPIRKYNPDTKNWLIPKDKKHLNKLLNKLSNYDVKVSFNIKEIENNNPRKMIIDSNKIYIKFPYNEDLVEEMRSLNQRRWDSDEKRWEASINKVNVDELVRIAEEYSFSGLDELKEIQDKLNQDFNKSQAVNADIEIDGLTDKLELKPFQKAGVKYAINKKRTIIADEVGLGKTVQAIASVEKTNNYPVLVICPAFLKLNWKAEFKKWLKRNPDIEIVNGETNEDIPQKEITIINYDILHHNKDLLKENNYNAIIIDESHYIKNHKAKRTEATQEIINEVNPEMRLELSATPIKNRPKELIPQLKALDKFENLGGFWYFVNRYCNAEKTRFGLDINGASNLKELHNKMRTECYIRRKKADVLSELPPVNRVEVPIEIDNREEYRKAEMNIINWIAENEGMEKAMKARYAEKLVKISKLRQLAVKGKMKNAIRWIKNFLESGEKLIVFTHHKETSNKLAKEFNALKITGDTSKEVKNEAVKQFQNNPNKKLIVISIQAGSEGITLTEASNVAFVEFGWTPTEHDQAEGRAYGRLNDIHGLNAYYLKAEDTIDEAILGLINKKREVVNKTIDGSHDNSEEIREDIVDNAIKKLMNKYN